jgi:hypothetical protein
MFINIFIAPSFTHTTNVPPRLQHDDDDDYDDNNDDDNVTCTGGMNIVSQRCWP